MDNSELKGIVESVTSVLAEGSVTKPGVGRGSSIVSPGRGLGSVVTNGIKKLSQDYLNTPLSVFGPDKVPGFNFNYFYTLDLRPPPGETVEAWQSGDEIYTDIFSDIYKTSRLATQMTHQLRLKYTNYVQNIIDTYLNRPAEIMNKHKGAGDGEDQPDEFEGNIYVKSINVDGNRQVVPRLTEDDPIWNEPLDTILGNPGVRRVYDDLPVVSTYLDSGGEHLAIKHISKVSNNRSEFVDLILDGLSSAIRGSTPMGITIEDILSGKFSRKPIMANQGTFINRVKDPTSDKSFDFRSWRTATLKELHKHIMSTFKLNSKLSEIVNLKEDRSAIGTLILKIKAKGDPIPPNVEDLKKKIVGFKRSDLFLYMSQTDFSNFEAGGLGFSKLAIKIGKGILGLLKPGGDTHIVKM